MYDIAITGHRPKDLPPYIRRSMDALVLDMLNRAFQRAYGETIRVHTGGALGIDQWVAAEIHKRRDDWAWPLISQIHLPFQQHIMGLHWDAGQRADLLTLMQDADEVCADCPEDKFSYAQYQRRNEHMVDSAKVVVAFWTGKTSGGTWNCIQYALAQNKPVYNALDGFERINPRAF